MKYSRSVDQHIQHAYQTAQTGSRRITIWSITLAVVWAAGILPSYLSVSQAGDRMYTQQLVLSKLKTHEESLERDLKERLKEQLGRESNETSVISGRLRTVTATRSAFAESEVQLKQAFDQNISFNIFNNDLAIPLEFAPVAWSLIALALVLNIVHTRYIVLRGVARAALRMKEQNAAGVASSELVTLPFWLSPLPKLVGSNGVRPVDLKAISGWQYDHRLVVVLTCLFVGTLVLLQASLIWMFARMWDAALAAGIAKVTWVGAAVTLFVVSGLMVYFLITWLLPGYVPDDDDRNPTDINRRRFSRAMIGGACAGIGSSVFLGLFGWGTSAALAKQRESRFAATSTRPRRIPTAKRLPVGLNPGVYRHKKTRAYHLVAADGTIDIKSSKNANTVLNERNLTRIRIEAITPGRSLLRSPACVEYGALYLIENDQLPLSIALLLN